MTIASVPSRIYNSHISDLNLRTVSNLTLNWFCYTDHGLVAVLGLCAWPWKLTAENFTTWPERRCSFHQFPFFPIWLWKVFVRSSLVCFSPSLRNWIENLLSCSICSLGCGSGAIEPIDFHLIFSELLKPFEHYKIVHLIHINVSTDWICWRMSCVQ